MQGAEATWCQVDLVDFGALDRSYCRTPVGLAWRIDRERFGLTLAAIPRATAHATGGVVHAAISRLPSSFELLIDARAVRMDCDGDEACAVQCTVDSALRTLRPRVRRYVMLAGQDAPIDWWHGVHLLAALPEPWRILTEPGEAFAWLGIDPAVADHLTHLGAHPEPDRRVSRAVEHLLDDLATSPAGQMELVARKLGMSVRSLQRALAREGRTFHALRTGRRLATACELLDRDERVERVAARIGFASVSHFVMWFRRHRGLTPSQFRRRRRDAHR
jgi:AraC-like DNA-binding protein